MSEFLINTAYYQIIISSPKNNRYIEYSGGLNSIRYSIDKAHRDGKCNSPDDTINIVRRCISIAAGDYDKDYSLHRLEKISRWKYATNEERVKIIQSIADSGCITDYLKLKKIEYVEDEKLDEAQLRISFNCEKNEVTVFLSPLAMCTTGCWDLVDD